MNAVDEPDLMRIVLHDHRTGSDAVAEESYALHQRSVGDAGGGENHAGAWREILGSVNPLEIGDAHRAATLLVLGCADDEAGEDLPAQTAHGRGGTTPLRRSPRSPPRRHAR